MVVVGLGGLALSTLIASATVWYLSMHQNINKSSDELSAVSAAYNEWNKIVHDDFVQTASKTGKSESVDVMGKFTVKKSMVLLEFQIMTELVNLLHNLKLMMQTKRVCQ